MSDTEKLRSTLDRLVGNDPSPSVRGAAARALLGYPGPDGADDLLARLLEHPEPQVRADVCSLISGRRIVANGFEAQLRGLLGDAAAVAPPASLDWRFPPDAEWMGALGRRVIPDRPAVTVGEAAFAALLAVTASTREQSRLAVDCLADPDGPTADRALRALNSVSVEYLAGRLEDPDPRVRAACARGAAALGPTAVSLAPALRRLLHDPERSVRLEAVRAVDILGAAVGDAEPDLVAMIPSGDGEMDLAACGALMTANALPMVLRPSGVLPQPAWGF